MKCLFKYVAKTQANSLANASVDVTKWSHYFCWMCVWHNNTLTKLSVWITIYVSQQFQSNLYVCLLYTFSVIYILALSLQSAHVNISEMDLCTELSVLIRGVSRRSLKSGFNIATALYPSHSFQACSEVRLSRVMSELSYSNCNTAELVCWTGWLWGGHRCHTSSPGTQHTHRHPHRERQTHRRMIPVFIVSVSQSGTNKYKWLPFL